MLGSHVRLLRDAVLSRLLSTNVEWTGIIVEEWISQKGNPTQYLVRFDDHLQPNLASLLDEILLYKHEFEVLPRAPMEIIDG
jgi:hypothetical protein